MHTLKKDFDILLIEDQEEDAILTMRSLKKRELVRNVKWLKDGEEVMSYVNELPENIEGEFFSVPSLILLDLKLPKINGLQLLRVLKDDPFLKKVPIVIMTSSNEEQDLEKAYDLGANSYIVKPIDFTYFEDTVKMIGKYWLEFNKNFI